MLQNLSDLSDDDRYRMIKFPSQDEELSVSLNSVISPNDVEIEDVDSGDEKNDNSEVSEVSPEPRRLAINLVFSVPSNSVGGTSKSSS